MTDSLDELAHLEAQEKSLIFKRFDNNDALRLGWRMVETARDRQLAIVVDIRRHGQLLFHAALPGTTRDNDAWVKRKVNVVNRFGTSSYLVGRRLARDRLSLEEAFGVDPREFAAHGGAFPVHIHGVGIIGTVTVSGLPQREDHALSST